MRIRQAGRADLGRQGQGQGRAGQGHWQLGGRTHGRRWMLATGTCMDGTNGGDS